MLRNFEELVAAVAAKPQKSLLAIAAAEDEAVIDAALRANAFGIAEPVYVGDSEKISAILQAKGVSPSACNIVACQPGQAGQRAAELVKDGQAQVLMKGLLETRDFLGPIVKKENGLRTGGVMSHVALFQIPGYERLLLSSDGGMLMYPTLEEKVHIIENAAKTMHALGYERPAFAVICAIEKTNPKMPETVEAARLQEMNLAGEITGCEVVGPISYDVAMSEAIAHHKKYDCSYCGHFDGVIPPNIQAGNIMGKCLTVTAGAKMAGIIVGAKAPVIMTSRGSDADEKFNSIAMAALCAGGTK